MSDFIPLVIGFERADAEKDAGDGNSMSTVVRAVTPEGNTCMLTGDSTNIVLDDMVDRYGAEYLKSDIVTTPHHGHNRDSYRARNATIKFYDAVKPEILVVTSSNMNKFTPTSKYPYEVNVHVIKNYDPEIYLMNAVRLISLATLKEIK
jgi:beta-lactamase superfamily II metal-dependent hydrolase